MSESPNLRAGWAAGPGDSRSCRRNAFFFQAEDGIRNLYVTGVQTCALPICQQLDGPGAGPAVRGRGVQARSQGPRAGTEIGRASCRERAEISGGAVTRQKKCVGGRRSIATAELTC